LAVRTPLFRSAHRGDVILFRAPAGMRPDGALGERFFVKRCIGIGGDTVTFANGGVAVNGRPLRFPDAAAVWRDPEGAFAGEQGKCIVVPEGSLFLLGDNPLRSSDSRLWGCIPEYDVVGRVALIYWSRHIGGDKAGSIGSIRWGRVGTRLR
jgi:signal peptidase I